MPPALEAASSIRFPGTRRSTRQRSSATSATRRACMNRTILPARSSLKPSKITSRSYGLAGLPVTVCSTRYTYYVKATLTVIFPSARPGAIRKDGQDQTQPRNAGKVRASSLPRLTSRHVTSGRKGLTGHASPTALIIGKLQIASSHLDRCTGPRSSRRDGRRTPNGYPFGVSRRECPRRRAGTFPPRRNFPWSSSDGEVCLRRV
jgi:hypothetical protein